MPTRWPRASPRPMNRWISWCACGTSATASGTAAIRTTMAFGRRATWWSRWTPRSGTAVAAASVTWKASWGIAPCGCDFLDMEPEEVFGAARHGDRRTGEFLKLWHRALAAGTANSIHLDGPGRFYL